MNKVLIILISLIIIILITSCTPKKENTNAPALDSINITILGEEKADAIIIKSPNGNILIDSGLDKMGEDILKKLSAFEIGSLDLMIITHFDKDHVGGADKIINSIDVKKVIHPNYTSNSKQYNEYIEALNNKGITPQIINTTENIDYGNLKISVYPPLKNYYGEDEDNEYSLVTSIIYGNNSFLFAGDAEKTRLQELKSQLETHSYDFLKLPHHGRFNKSSSDFLNLINPKYSVITCSNEKLPDERILDILKSLNSKVFLSKDGDINIASNGNDIKIDQ